MGHDSGIYNKFPLKVYVKFQDVNAWGARSQETRKERVAKRLENLNRNVVILIVLSNKK